jgi:putative SOS response-associated peptidase YedK
VCGRYVFTSPFEAIVRLFSVDELHAGPYEPRYNIAPTQDVPIVRNSPFVGDGQAGAAVRELVLARWGLVPFWAKDISTGNRMINARAETVAETPAFRAAFRKRRCLVPADGFYEWKKSEGAKQPWFIRARSGEPLAFAGLWELWDAKGVELRLQTCTIITTRANAFMAPLHARMPAVLQADAREPWLDADTPASELLGLLQPRDDDSLEAWPVSRKVNSPFNEAPELIEPWRPRANRVGD